MSYRSTPAPTSRPRLLQAGIDAFQQPEIRSKIVFTLGMLLIFRFFAHVPVPGIDPERLKTVFDQNAILGFMNVFSGGALRNLSVVALGVYPFITASIIGQLGGNLIPRLRQLQQEGEAGRAQVRRYMTYLTVPLAAFQAYAQLIVLQQLNAVSGIGMNLTTIATLFSMVAGTMFLVWMGELISENGVGNGTSILIFGGIIAGLPSTLGQGALSGTAAIGGMLLLAAITVAVVWLIVLFQEAQRRIPVQYARSTFRGGRMYRQQGQSHIPLRVNSVGMIPLIFAFSIMIFPPAVAQFVASSVDVGWIRSSAQFVERWMAPDQLFYWLIVFVLVVMFTFLYTTVVFQEQNLAENLQRQGGFIPGIRPGRPTQEYITRVLTRITWGGAFFLGFISVLPFFATGLTGVQALQVSASGLLIVVGVVIDTMRQLEAQMLMRNYEGFIS